MNIQGLTKVKYTELEELIDDKSILCLTETQKKVRNIIARDDIKILDNMREIKDKKGGGIMMLYKESKGLKFKKIISQSNDLLHVKGEMWGWNIRIIIVYFSVNDKETKNEK